MKIKIETNAAVKKLMAILAGKNQQVKEATARATARAGALAQREAINNAPRSPTKAQWSAQLKRKKKTSRKDFFPGGLEKSIELSTDEEKGEACVFVRGNSYAGKYARKIHDEKGRTWHNRGVGTIAKGIQADDKFIDRAVRKNAGVFKKIYQDELEKALRKGKR